MGRLTTHVLDTMHGCPASGVAIALYRLDAQGRPAGEAVASRTTNADGRCDAPLLEGAGLTAGTYELRFQVGAYFRARGVALPEPAFLDEVPIRFGVHDAAGHYHVPLLVSPYAFSTYRGS
jgi:5-hydroxyisourate hydrolase